MRPLPRLLALTDDHIAILPDLGIRAAALAAVGSVVALVARLPMGSTNALAELAARLRSLAVPPMAQMFVTGRGDVGASTMSHGIILRGNDLRARDVRAFAGDRPIIASVHSEAEAHAAREESVDGLLLGTIWASNTHPGRPPAGIELLKRVVALGLPTWAIGGVTADRAAAAHDAGAWGVASISSAWQSHDPYQSALDLTAPWRTES